MVLERHELFVERPGEHEAAAAARSVRVPQPRVPFPELAGCRLLSATRRRRATGRRGCARASSRERASSWRGAPRASASANARSSRSSSASIRSVSPAASSRNPSASARPNAPARTESHSPSWPEMPAVTRADTALGSRAAVSSMHARASAKTPGSLDCDPGVMANVRVDVGRHERRDGRVVRREAHAQRAHERAVPRLVDRLVGRALEDRDERRRVGRRPQPRGRVANLPDESGVGDSGFQARNDTSGHAFPPVNAAAAAVAGYSSSGLARLPKRSRKRSM